MRAIFCDISKVLVKVCHKGGPLLNQFTDYLDNRVQRVVLPGASSSWASVNPGVPQGSIFGPFLFFKLKTLILQ